MGTRTKKDTTWLMSSKNRAKDLLITQLDHTDLSFQQEPGKVFVAINTFWVIHLHSRELPANSIWKERSHWVCQMLGGDIFKGDVTTQVLREEERTQPPPSQPCSFAGGADGHTTPMPVGRCWYLNVWIPRSYSNHCLALWTVQAELDLSGLLSVLLKATL